MKEKIYATFLIRWFRSQLGVRDGSEDNFLSFVLTEMAQFHKIIFNNQNLEGSKEVSSSHEKAEMHRIGEHAYSHSQLGCLLTYEDFS